MNKKKQGDVGVAMAISHYTKMNHVVCYPLTDTARYDLIVDINGVLHRVQCKTTGYKTKHGIYSVQLKTAGGNQSWNGTVKKISKQECDLLFVYVLDGSCYEFPPSVYDNMGSINLGKQFDKYKLG